MTQSLLDYLALAAVGSVAGVVNVVAGGGSFLTLPAMIFLGLPPTMANGTNRVAILLQNVAATWSFDRHEVVDWSWVRLAALPVLAGAGLGTWIAVSVGDEAFRKSLSIIMVVVALWTIWNPVGRRDAEGILADRGDLKGRLLLIGGFFLVGVYGGYVQAGVGFLILALAAAAGLDMVRGNALKVLVTLVFTPLALGLFAWQGHVDWDAGLALAFGNVTGGLIGVRITVLKGHDWVKKAVTVAVVVFAVRLWIGG